MDAIDFSGWKRMRTVGFPICFVSSILASTVTQKMKVDRSSNGRRQIFLTFWISSWHFSSLEESRASDSQSKMEKIQFQSNFIRDDFFMNLKQISDSLGIFLLTFDSISICEELFEMKSNYVNIRMSEDVQFKFKWNDFLISQLVRCFSWRIAWSFS